ncbi:MAG: trypsin-like peptidase domain-containing protein [Thermoguttaceae bacterium]
MAADLFYQTAGQQSGPVDSRELRRLAEAGIVRPDTLVRQGTSNPWVRAERVQGLFQGSTPTPSLSLVASAPPPPPVPESGEAVNEASEKPERIWPVTWAAIIVASGTVLLLLWAVVFRGGSPPRQQAEKDQPLLAATRSAKHSGAAPAAESKFADGPTTRKAGTPIDQQLTTQTQPTPENPVLPLPDAKDTGQESEKSLDTVALYANSRAAVATILTKDDAGFDAGQGSGFFIAGELIGTRYAGHSLTGPSETGRAQWAYLLTNYHVIRSAATVELRLDDGRLGSVHEVVLEQEDADLALVVVYILDSDQSSKPTKPIGVLSIAEGQEPAVGQRVYAIGSPQGLEASLSEGIISGRREVAEGIWWLQTTAPVSPGSSGGPLLDSTGQVVGLVTAQWRGGQNLNFAVPASQVVKFLKGRCNSRRLWRGTGIKEEENDAYSSALVDAAVARDEGNTERVGGKLLFKASQQIGQGDYDGAAESLAAIDRAQCGQFEFLLHHTLGRVAEHRVYKRAAGNWAVGELSKLCRNDKDFQLAKKSFRKSIELNSEFSPAYQHLAECLKFEREWDESLPLERRLDEPIALADSLVKMVPRCVTAYKLRGGLYSKVHRRLEALADFDTAAELGPNDPETHFEIGTVCSSLGEYEKAIEAYKAAMRLNFYRASVCPYNMGIAYQKMGRFEQAIGCFEESGRLGFCPFGFGCENEVARCRKHSRVPYPQ